MRCLILVFVALVSTDEISADPLYSVTRMDNTLSIAYTSGALNDLGQVATATSNGFVPAIWSNGTLTLLDTLGFAEGINNSGHVAGYVSTSSGASHAAVYADGIVTDLGTLGGQRNSLALAINNVGQVIGYSNNFRDETHAFVYSNGVMTDLGTLGGSFTIPDAINDSGQIVGGTGNFPPGTPGFHAFLYRDGTMTDLGTLGGSSSRANSINNSGQVVGDAATSSESHHAFLYGNGLMIDLGTLGGDSSQALGINNAGHIVGVADTSSGGRDPFLYSNGAMIDLNSLIDPSLNLTLRDAYAINNAGQILADGFMNGSFTSYVLTPVPEPSPWLLLSGGLLGLAIFRCWQRKAKKSFSE